MLPIVDARRAVRAVPDEICGNVPSSDVLTRRRVTAMLRKAFCGDRYAWKR